MRKNQVAALTVNAEGRVAFANPAARDRFPGCVGRRCADVVRFVDATGATVCSPTCWGELARGEGARDVEGRSGGGGAARLLCTAVETADGTAQGAVLLVPPRPPSVAPRIELSAREREVLGWMVRGRTGPQIARLLGIQPSTVRTHVDHVKEKLGVRKNTELVSKALKLGLADG